MGSQTLEILRQGVWASITGGWFYDPHQNIFCNTIHLYIWLFLLCLPFAVYLYFPPSLGGWSVYCGLVALLFSFIKLLNHSLHHMYDTTECIIIPTENLPPNEKRRPQKKQRDEEGIELQMLGAGRLSVGKQRSDNESVTSLEYHKPTNSTIDLKVDFHRKNSSESSVDESDDNKTAHENVSIHKAEAHGAQAGPSTSQKSSRARVRPVTRRDRRRWMKQRNGLEAHQRAKIEEISSEEGLRIDQRSKHDDSVAVNIDNDGPTTVASRKLHREGQNCDAFKGWLYLDGSEAAGEQYQSKFARQLSSDSHVNAELSHTSPGKKKTHHRCSNMYGGESCTKSSITLAQPNAQTNMRRNSNATMSTIQLPLLNSTAQLVSHMRRHSHVTNASLGCLPTGSVELDAYILDETGERVPRSKGKGKAKTKISGVRRIKSTALEIGCPPPSVSNLSPHPNSVEAIGGQVLKNPKNAVLPPPSKCLIRNPHLNLYPNSSSNRVEGCYPCLNYGSEIVYPIAEISDEMQTSQCQDSDLESMSSYSDYGGSHHHWDTNHSLEPDSSDSDYENNGSRSPLLDKSGNNDPRIVKRQDAEHRKHLNLSSDKCINVNKNISVPEVKQSDRNKHSKTKKNFSYNSNIQSALIEDGSVNVQNVNSSGNTISKGIDYNNSANTSNDTVIPKKQVCGSDVNFDMNVKDLSENLNSALKSDDCIIDVLESDNEGDEKGKMTVEKCRDNEMSNSSVSLEMQEAKPEVANESSDVSKRKTPDVHSCITQPHEVDTIEEDFPKDCADSHLYDIKWLFEDTAEDFEAGNTSTYIHASISQDSNSEPAHRNLGAIPKQMKNPTRSRGSSEKENKKKDKKDREQKEREDSKNEEFILMDAVEAHSALVQGLECLFAATNANTVVMPPLSREERQRGHIKVVRKRSIEEVAHTSTNTLLPTSMPLLAAFLNSRVDFPHVPIYLPAESNPGPSEFMDPTVRLVVDPSIHDPQRSRPLMDRNHRNRIRKIKRSTRQRNNPPAQASSDKSKEETPPSGEGTNSSNVHFATSFNDTTDGAIHCFIDEYGHWMSYTFDKNSSGQAVIQPISGPERDDKVSRSNLVKPTDSGDIVAARSAHAGSCVSIESVLNEPGKSKRVDSVDQTYTNGSIYNSSSNQGSNNPLLSSNNNSTSLLPAGNNTSSKRLFICGTGAPSDQPRSPVAYVTDRLLEQIEADRQFRINPTPNMQNFMCQVPGQPNVLHISMPVSGSIGDNSLDLSITRKGFTLLDSIEQASMNQPKSYYKFKLMKCWEVKVTMDRLKLMALFDRNLTFRETFISIMLAIMVSVLGAMILNVGFYKDIYAFWFCFVMAGCQYSLLKSVQPDSASPVHGFNKMVAFSRPVYFCLCTAILYGIHYHVEQYPSTNEDRRITTHLESRSDTFTLYGMVIVEKDFLLLVEDVLSKFLLLFPVAFSLGLFPQVNTFMMYFFEQIDMHVFGGNATSSLSASIYCVVRSFLGICVLYGFAYSGLIEEKGSQHILFSIFCGLLIPLAYHLSRSASDYTLMWNLIKNNLLPPEFYTMNNVELLTADLDKLKHPETVSEKSTKNKNNSESNISKQVSVNSSVSKVNFSSETNISKTQNRSQKSSSSSLKLDSRIGDTVNSTSSIKIDTITENDDQNKSKQDIDEKVEDDEEDPLPRKLQDTFNSRLKNDLIVCTFMAVCIFGIHCTTVFSTIRPELNPIIRSIAAIVGWVLHYMMPQMRKQQPWLWLSKPVLKAHEYAKFEVREPARVMWFEKAYVYLCFIERNIIYPVIFISAVTEDAPNIVTKFGPTVGAFIVCICALKCVRNAYSDPDSQYLILVFAILLFSLDFQWASESFLVDYFIMAVVFNKMYEFLLKIQFVVTYIAPWQITWGSAFHAFAQPFSVPHSAMLFMQAALSALLSTPLNPVLGSAIFITSYVRPVKFWERDYNTKRVDQSNTRLSSQLDRNLGSDDNNLNSIFYEHLTRSLQHYLCGDLALGRWGQVQQGDCFVLASDYLNCLVHIVEMGNGLVSFQLRGLEFRGTYCQQREVEAISEGPEENDGCCCCAVGHLPRMLSVNAMFSLRWLAWQLTSAKYVLEGYSISDNSAVSMLQSFDFRKILVTYYVKSIIYYTMQSQKLEDWLVSVPICEALKTINDRNFVDLDPIFSVFLDDDYDFQASGITRASFCSVYHDWIMHCATRREDLYRKRGDKLLSRDSALVSLCFALSLVGRRSLSAASHNTVSSVEFFLHGLHALFKGDFRITCVRDEWVFSDMSLLHSILAPAVRMALKLHQDHFMSPDDYCSPHALFSAITCHSACLVICHEAAPAWRTNVLKGAPHLLALRHVMDDGNDEYKIIMLNKRQLGFRVIKLNRECVRGLWAGQQQELVFLRNRNPERGSIQNAKQALRNIINSSCDQPIGYPIYVSPLTTSYAESSQQLSSLLGGSLTFGAIRKLAVGVWRRVRRRCGEGCSSGSAGTAGSGVGGVGGGAGGVSVTRATPGLATPRHNTLDLSRTSLAGTRGSLASVSKPTSSTLASLAGLLGSREHSLAPAEQPRPTNTIYYERDTDTAYATIRETSSERKRRTVDERRDGEMSRSHRRTRDYKAGHPMQPPRDRSKEGARRSKRDRERDRIRPASFRLLSTQERDAAASRSNEGYEMQALNEQGSSNRIPRHQHVGDNIQKSDSRQRERSREPRRCSSAKVPSQVPRPPTPGSSLEDLTLNPSGLEGVPDCKLIPNRGANCKYLPYYSQPQQKRRSSDLSDSSRDFPSKNQSERNISLSSKEPTSIEASSEHSILKRYSNESSTSKDLAKVNKDLKHERETYRDLTGKYNELSGKEAVLRVPLDQNQSQIKVKVKRSDSQKTELKSHVSVGCKVMIVDPMGVYDCINLGRRIDVQWPSEHQREKGGRNSWGSWVPQQGMDGQVVHRWSPNHRDPKLRSHVDKTILLVQIGERFIPIAEQAVQDLGDEV